MAEMSPLYLYYGEERFLIDQDLQRFRRYFSSGAAGAFDVREYDGRKASLAEIIDDAETPPFFAEKRLMIVDHAPWFKGDAEAAAPLAEYMESPADFTCLILVADEVDKRRKLFKAAGVKGKVRACEKLSRWDMAKYVGEAFKKQGKRIDPAAADLLLQLLPGDLAIVHGEIEKIITYLGEEKTAAADIVLRLVAKSQEATNFQLSDALGERDMGRLLPILREVLDNLSRDKQMALHGYIVNFFRLLLRAKGLKEKGREVSGKTLGIHDFRARKAAQAAEQYRMEELLQGLTLLLEMDYKVKSGQAVFEEIFYFTVLRIAAGPAPV